MDIETKIKLQPFGVPNYVLIEGKPRVRQDGFKETPKYHLSELDSAILTQLCDRFRDEVFKKAGKEPI